MRDFDDILHLVSSYPFPLALHFFLNKSHPFILMISFILRGVSLVTDSDLGLILVLLLPNLPEERFVLIGDVLNIDLIKFIFDSLEFLASHRGVNGPIEQLAVIV